MPVAGMFIGLVIAFAFDPMAMFLTWSTVWLPFAGLAVGIALRFGLQRYYDAR
jgi:hypothetical protein